MFGCKTPINIKHMNIYKVYTHAYITGQIGASAGLTIVKIDRNK